MNKRIFKFRAWNGNEKEMIYLDTNEAIGTNSLSVETILNNNPEDNHVLMQWTGFTDSEGKDIYEGDVIYDAFYELDLEIGWDAKWAKFEATRNDKYHEYISISLHEFEDDYTKVLGNIYENPELLEDRG